MIFREPLQDAFLRRDLSRMFSAQNIWCISFSLLKIMKKLVSLCFTGWRAERSGATYAAPLLFYDCLFVLICAEQERDDLRSGAGGVRVKSAAAYAGRDAVFHRPCNCLCIVSVRRNIHKRAHALGFRRTCRAPQEGDRLRSGARCIRAEQVVSGTAGNAVFHCPGNRFA